MSQFYSRYVPPTTTNSASLTPSTNLKRPLKSKSSQPKKRRKFEASSTGDDILAKYSTTESARNYASTEEVVIRKKTKGRPANKNTNGELKEVPEEDKQDGRTKKNLEDGDARGGTQEPEVDEFQLKHSTVFSKLKKSMEEAKMRPRPEKQAVEEGADTSHKIHPDRADKMDLGPIPQPQDPEPISKPLLYSTLPDWVQDPIRVDEGAQSTFEELGIRKNLVKNLQAQGKNKALPVQSTVLPLLLDKEVERRDDLCVAAATGSGKTLAYVLPILQSLRKRPRVALTSVIVVPTRALVKQVFQALESCSAGLDILLGSVEGSKTLEEERKQLIEERMVYNPDEYQRQQESPVDWSAFSLEDAIDQAFKTDLLANVGHISEYSSKVDILVATPGRLIDHLQSTKGFNLDDVQWFVADEADRLLNESYHDWLDVVLPALKSQKATERRDRLLEQMRMDVPKRRMTKILLSATMTNDISQLMSLELRNPKFVMMENVNAVEAHDTGEVDTSNSGLEFTLPSHLQEYAIAFKDSDNKPLYLLELLNQHILQQLSHISESALKSNTTASKPLTNDVHSDTTSSSSSDSSSESDSDSSGSPIATDDDHGNDSDSSLDSSSSSSSSSSASSGSSASHVNDPSAANKTTNLSSAAIIPPSEHSAKVPLLPRALIFSKSTESAHRLARLLCLLSPSLEPIIATLTRSTSSNSASQSAATTNNVSSKQQQRTFRKTLSSFISGHTRILISTDLSSRGLDIPNLEHVVNYDVPASALTYVHRVGRTARAGQKGCAWTLVEHKQGKWFWETIAGKINKGENMGGGENAANHEKNNSVIGRASGKRVGRVEIKIADEWKGKYEDALQQLESDVVGR